jgi:TetR/AcrR family transcriptional regulator, transcriptional repressor for nem operon
MTSRRGKRAASRQATREALIEAGIAAFASSGLDAPSLDSICERAGYTRGAFYVHFDDRDDFIVAVMDRLTEGFMESIFGSEEAPTDLPTLVSRFAQSVASGRYPIPGTVRLHHVLDACARSPVVRARRAKLMRDAMSAVAELARAGQRAGLLRGNVESGQLGVLLLAIALGIEVLTELQVPFDAAPAADTVLELVRAAGPRVEPQPGRSRAAAARPRARAPRAKKRR